MVGERTKPPASNKGKQTTKMTIDRGKKPRLGYHSEFLFQNLIIWQKKYPPLSSRKRRFTVCILYLFLKYEIYS